MKSSISSKPEDRKGRMDRSHRAAGSEAGRGEAGGAAARHHAGDRRLLHLVQVSRQVMAEGSPNGVLAKTAAAVLEMSGAGWCACGYEHPEGVLRVEIRPEGADPPALTAEQVRSLYRGSVRPELTGEPTVRLRGRALARRYAAWDLQGTPLPGGDLLAARLLDCECRPTGLILVGGRTGAPFTARDEALLAQLASIVSLTLQHLQAHEDADQQIRERTAVADRRARQLQALALELSEAEETERRRIGGMLHEDLQQLLASVRFQLQALQRSIRSDKAPEGLVENMHRLLDESLLKCRYLAEELSPPVLHLGGLPMAVNWLAEQMEIKHGLSVQVDMRGWSPVEDEPLRIFLFRTIQELLLNVVKHSGVQNARVLMRSDGTRAEISVSDEGRGFDSRVVEGRSGSGLLSIAERVRFLGGSIDIESNAGRGSRLRMSLPLQGIIRPLSRKPDREDRPAVRPGVGGEGGRMVVPPGPRLQVLLADDHKLMRQGLSTLLGNLPDILVVGEASDGQEAVERVRELAPDVVLMDVSMPRMDGIEATRRIKAEWPGVRVIALSMFEEGEVARRMREAGAEAYLSKSGPSEGLIEAIRRPR